MEIAGALLHRPKVLFLDEPTIGLDITMQRRIRTFVADYNERYGATVILTSHYMADVQALCKRVIVIHHGRLVFDGDLSRCPSASRRNARSRPAWPDGEEITILHVPRRHRGGHHATAGRLRRRRPHHRGPADRRRDRAGLRRRRRRLVITLYTAHMRMAVLTQFQYRAANYFYMIGMIAEPVVYLVVWSTIARANGGSIDGLTPGDFAAYYIVWTLVRNMNIVLTPFAWEERIKDGTFSGQLMRAGPSDPRGPRPVRGLEGGRARCCGSRSPSCWCLLFKPYAQPDARCSASCSSSPSGARTCSGRSCSGRWVSSRSGPRGSAAIFEALLPHRAAAVGPGVPAGADAALVPDADVVLPVPLVLQLPDRRAHRARSRTASCSSAWACSWPGSCSASACWRSCGRVPSAVSVRWADDVSRRPPIAGRQRSPGRDVPARRRR